MQSQKILIVAGEPSGDLHAAPVVRKLKKLDPALEFSGSGGKLMSAEGVELLATIDELAVMGFSSIPKILPRLNRLKRLFISRIIRDQVRLVILVDYPGFNLKLAESIKKLPNPPLILEYIAPQVWAWRAGRINKIKRVVDQLAVVFPFEEDLFTKRGVNATYVGHPLLDEIHPKTANDTSRLLDGKPLLAVLPGSRPAVAQKHINTLTFTIRKLSERYPELQIGIGKAETTSKELLRPLLNASENCTLYESSRGLMRKATAGIVCSGTATLESALLGMPQVVIYKTSGLNYHIIRTMIKLPYVAMANIVAGDRIVPELLQYDFTTEKIIHAISPLLRDSKQRSEMLLKYADIRQKLGSGGAAQRVANLAYNMLEMR